MLFFPLTWGSTWKHHLLQISDAKIYTGSASTLLALKHHIFNAVGISDQYVPLHSHFTLASYGKYLELTGTKTVITVQYLSLESMTKDHIANNALKLYQTSICYVSYFQKKNPKWISATACLLSTIERCSGYFVTVQSFL